MVDVLGQMSVASDAPDLRVVLELLLQLLAVVDGLPLSRSQLRDTREDELLRLQLNGEGVEMKRGEMNGNEQNRVKRRKGDDRSPVLLPSDAFFDG